MKQLDGGGGGFGKGWLVVTASVGNGQTKPRANAGAAGKDSVAQRRGEFRRRAWGLCTRKDCFQGLFDTWRSVHGTPLSRQMCNPNCSFQIV